MRNGSNVIPCHRRYGTSYLSPVNSKLEIIPTGIKNFAVSGDFAESDNDTVFSEEYIVSTARTASYKLMKTNRKMFESKPKSFRESKKSLKKLGKIICFLKVNFKDFNIYNTVKEFE